MKKHCQKEGRRKEGKKERTSLERSEAMRVWEPGRVDTKGQPGWRSENRTPTWPEETLTEVCKDREGNADPKSEEVGGAGRKWSTT